MGRRLEGWGRGWKGGEEAGELQPEALPEQSMMRYEGMGEWRRWWRRRSTMRGMEE